jgi:hypothetical protein
MAKKCLISYLILVMPVIVSLQLTGHRVTVK